MKPSRLAIAALGGLVSAAIARQWLTLSEPSDSEPSFPHGNTAMNNDNKRAQVVELARAELGKRDLARYFASAAPAFLGSNPAPEWCGIFGLYVLRTVGLTDWQWRIGLGFLYRLPVTTSPKPGDMAYFDKNQHHAIVAGVRGDEVDLINGNGMGGVVTASTAPLSKAKAYYSIQPLLDAKA